MEVGEVQTGGVEVGEVQAGGINESEGGQPAMTGAQPRSSR